MVIIDFDPSSASRYVRLGFNIVVVDVLRATSTICTAISSGAEKIYPCADIEEAFQLRTSAGAILVGERSAEMIPGFDYTNSPYDLKDVDLSGSTIAITTSTGTKLISECKGSANVLIGTTLNARAVAKEMIEIGGNWVVIGAGSRGEFRPEDKVGCALIVSYLVNCELGIDAGTLEFVRNYTENRRDFILRSPSTLKLLSLGRECDVQYIIDHEDSLTFVPRVEWIDNRSMIIP